MVEKIIRQLEQYNRAEHDEDLFLLSLQTRAEGISNQYGDEGSHGAGAGDRMANGSITLAEAREKINARRVERFDYRSEVCDWFHDRLKPQAARVMEMYAVDGMDYRQIANKTGRSLGWVSGIVNESKKNLGKGL